MPPKGTVLPITPQDNRRSPLFIGTSWRWPFPVRHLCDSVSHKESRPSPHCGLTRLFRISRVRPLRRSIGEKDGHINRDFGFWGKIPLKARGETSRFLALGSSIRRFVDRPVILSQKQEEAPATQKPLPFCNECAGSRCTRVKFYSQSSSTTRAIPYLSSERRSCSWSQASYSARAWASNSTCWSITSPLPRSGCSRRSRPSLSRPRPSSPPSPRTGESLQERLWLGRGVRCRWCVLLYSLQYWY